MGLVVVFKAGMSGALGIIIAVGVVLAAYSSVEEQMRTLPIKIKKIPFFLIFIVLLLGGLFIFYELITQYVEDFANSNETLLTIYACAAALTPSLSLILSSLIYYLYASKKIQEYTRKN